MIPKPDKELARMIQRHAGAKAMRVQLRRMQAFAAPDDSDGVFRHLLDKLDRAAAEKGHGSGDPAIPAQDPDLSASPPDRPD